MNDDAFFTILSLTILAAVIVGDAILMEKYDFQLLTYMWAGWTTSSWAQMAVLRRERRNKIAILMQRYGIKGGK